MDPFSTNGKSNLNNKAHLMKFLIYFYLFSISFSSFAGSIGDYDGSTTSFSWIYDTPFRKADIKTTIDSNSKTEKTIGRSGGTIVTKSEDGIEYTLTIPANAIHSDTQITFSAVKEMKDIPFGDSPVGVILKPDGLKLNKPAILTIKSPKNIPIENQIFFGFEKDGENLIFAPPVVKSKEMQIQILHFSGYGVTKGYWADYAKFRKLIGGDIESRVASTIAEKFGKERARELMGIETPDNEDIYKDLETALKEYYFKVLIPRLERIRSGNFSCSEAKLAKETVLSFARQTSMAGYENYANEVNEVVFQTDIDHQCMKEEYEICRDQHIFHRIFSLYTSNVRMRDILNQQNAAEDAYELDLVKKCLQFDVELNTSTNTTMSDPSLNFRLTAKMHIGFVEDESTGGILKSDSGQSEITYYDGKFRNPVCTIKFNRGAPGIFFSNATIIVPKKSGDPFDDLADLKMYYMVSALNDNYTVSCNNMPPITAGNGMWFALYVGAHAKERENPTPDHPSWGGLTFKDWTLHKGAPLAAEKNWDITNSNNAHDKGNVSLFHRPE